jgi:hypothetical protein
MWANVMLVLRRGLVNGAEYLQGWMEELLGANISSRTIQGEVFPCNRTRCESVNPYLSVVEGKRGGREEAGGDKAKFGYLGVIEKWNRRCESPPTTAVEIRELRAR